jgi:endoglucanase
VLKTPAKHIAFIAIASLSALFAIALGTMRLSRASLATLPLYQDGISPNWENWSWGTSINFDNPAPNNSGQKSMWVKFSPWGALYFHSQSEILLSNYTDLSLAIQQTPQGKSNQKLKLLFYDVNNTPAKELPLSHYGPDPNPNQYVTYTIPLSDVGLSSIKGIALQDAEGVDQTPIFVDTIELHARKEIQSTNIETTPSPMVSLSPSSQITPTPTVIPAQIISNTVPKNTGFSTSQNKIYDNGQEIVLHGINWFGFETETLAPHGLWARNYKDMIGQMKTLGFNAVRIPVCPLTLQNSPVTSIDYIKNPDLKGLSSIQVLDTVVGELDKDGMYILLDHHRPDCNAISELWYTPNYTEDQWISDLEKMATRYKNTSHFMGIDLKNEPHGNASWGTGNISTDWNSAAERAGKQVSAANANILIFVEGVGENATCSSQIAHMWGENIESSRCHPISNVIPTDKLVLSPHVYGPDVFMQAYFSDATFPENMPQIWDTQFGSLRSTNTLVVGEWGGKFGLAEPKDLVFQKKLISYFISKNMCSSFYWSWNPDSGDTGGILLDDWNSVSETKMSLLQSLYQGCHTS